MTILSSIAATFTGLDDGERERLTAVLEALGDDTPALARAHRDNLRLARKVDALEVECARLRADLARTRRPTRGAA